MSLFKTLFGKKKDETNETSTAPRVSSAEGRSVPKSTPYDVQSLVLLTLAESFKVGEKKYPEYLRSSYGIGFPDEKLKKLASAGLLRPTTAIETLPQLKGAELKDIAVRFGLKASGKKEEICSRIEENVSEEQLSNIVLDRYWAVTDEGKALLDENKHIVFYMEKHPYNLASVGLDIHSYAKLFSGKSNGRVRDVLWGTFNRMSGELYHKGMSQGQFSDYCVLLHVMALFLEEENRHNDSLAMYMRYLYYRANFYGGLSALQTYSFSRDVDDAATTLYYDTQMLPFIANELHSLSDACGFDSHTLRKYMTEAFTREKDEGLFSNEELSSYVMCGLNGDNVGQMTICKKVMRAASKKVPKRK